MCYVAHPDGHQSAFWLMPDGGIIPGGVADGTADDGAEIDIVEANRQTPAYTTNLHWDGYGEHHQSAAEEVEAAQLHTVWHNVFGLLWTPERLEFFFNESSVRTVDDPDRIPDIPQYPIVSGGVFAGSWVDGDVVTAEFPDWMYVDYVRVWRRADR